MLASICAAFWDLCRWRAKQSKAILNANESGSGMFREPYPSETRAISSPGAQLVPAVRKRWTIVKLGPEALSAAHSSRPKSISSIIGANSSAINHQPRSSSLDFQPWSRSICPRCADNCWRYSPKQKPMLLSHRPAGELLPLLQPPAAAPAVRLSDLFPHRLMGDTLPRPLGFSAFSSGMDLFGFNGNGS
jgi:hypothetical protein